MPLVLLLDFIFLLLIRFFIKIVITIFGWATNIFFGKLPDKNKVWFYIMMILSFVWIYCLLAKLFPSMFGIFTGYIPEKTFTKVMRHLLYIICVVAIPPGVGALGAMITGVSRQNKTKFAQWLLKGYRYTLVLGCTMAVILVCTPIIRIKRMLKHKSAEGMAMGVAGKGNIYVMDEIIIALSQADIRTVKKIPSKFYSVPVKMINGIMKDLFNYVADRELYIAGEDISIYLNSSDIMIEGSIQTIEKAKMSIVKSFVENDIYLTESDKSKKIESEILTIYKNWKIGLKNSDKTLELLRNLTNSSFDGGMTYEEWALLSVQINEVQNKVLYKKTNCEEI